MASGSGKRSTTFGDPIFEGDMVIPQEMFQQEESKGMGGRTAVAEPVLYWPGAVIPYQFHSCKYFSLNLSFFLASFFSAIVSLVYVSSSFLPVFSSFFRSIIFSSLFDPRKIVPVENHLIRLLFL